MADKETEQLVGCGGAILSLCTTTPMWLVLLFVLLQAGGDAVPVWAWVLYWVYVPTNVLVTVVMTVCRQLLSR